MQTLSSEQRASFETAVSKYQAALAVDTSAQDYLTGRGFGPEVAAQYRLGVATSPQVGDEPHRGRLIIPYLTPAGVVNYRSRCLKPHKCKDTVLFTDDKGKPVTCVKYKGAEGVESNLFNVLALKQASDFICITEGELDAITLTMCGLPAVAVPGVHAWKDHFGRCLEDFQTIYSFADGDTAGQGLAKHLIKEVKARRVRLPKGKDCNDIYRKGGAGAVRKLLAE